MGSGDSSREKAGKSAASGTSGAFAQVSAAAPAQTSRVVRPVVAPPLYKAELPQKRFDRFMAWLWMRPMLSPSGLLYCAAAGLLVFQSSREPDAGARNLLILVAAGLIGLLLASAMVGWFNLRKVAVRRRLPSSVHAGVPVLSTLLVHNSSRVRPACLVRLSEDDVTNLAFKDDALTAVYVPRGGYARLQTEATFLKRGHYQLSGMLAQSAFPLGLVTFKRALAVRSPVVVYPKPLALPRWLVSRLLWHGQSAGERVAARTGEDEVNGLREYRPGDNIRRIHWRTTARRGHPMLLEMEGRMDMRFMLVLDTYVAQADANTRAELEQLISLTAGIAARLFRYGMAVGLRFHNGQYLVQSDAVRGTVGYHAIMEHLAGIGAQSKPLETWFEDGIGAVPRGVFPVVLTMGAAAAAREFIGVARAGMVLSIRDLEVAAMFATASRTTASAAATSTATSTGGA